MRRAYKNPTSSILTNGLRYQANNGANNKKIAELLLQEQKGYCAYTDELISRTDAKDIEHFNPYLKGTANDHYNNWFVVKHQWNKEKSQKWADFQPVLHPTTPDFEDRIIYISGDYIAAPNDEEASNLIKLLQLDDLMLAEKRKKYINRRKKEIAALGPGHSPATYFTILMEEEMNNVLYPRAIKEEFGVDVFSVQNSSKA